MLRKLVQKSLFNEGEDFVKLALDAWEHGIEVDLNAKEHNVGRIIGLDDLGNPTSKVRVILNEKMDELRSVYPIEM